MKKQVELTIKDIPDSLNRYLNYHWSKRSETKERWRLMILSEWTKQKGIKLDSPIVVTLEYYFPDNRKRDYDNYSGKVILDGLKNTFIEDDNARDCVKELKLKMFFSQPEKKTVITIKEI